MNSTSSVAMLSATRDSLIKFQNSQGFEVRASVLRLERYLIVFEVYSPFVLQLSEVLSDFQIILNEASVYSGKAVVRNLVNTGTGVICEATLDSGWRELGTSLGPQGWEQLRRGFEESLREWGRMCHVHPEFKIVIADMQILFMDLRRWMEQIELEVRSQPVGDRAQMERATLEQCQQPIVAAVSLLLEQFEELALRVPEDFQPMHQAYMKRQIHPLVLCSPFLYRTFQKPLGYAGDYEMVNMMLRDPYEGGSMFAKILNKIFLETPPVIAHRDRIEYLTQLLVDQTQKNCAMGQATRVYNLGCGPAQEVQNFLQAHAIADRAEFTLLDFNEETLVYTSGVLGNLKTRHGRGTPIQLMKKSVHQILKDAAKPSLPGAGYDLVYCAGLFDYLYDPVCRKLLDVFYRMVVPGGMVVVTNVEKENPSRNWMEYVLEWFLVYRGGRQLEALLPAEAVPGHFRVRSIGAGVNIALELTKPLHAE